MAIIRHTYLYHFLAKERGFNHMQKRHDSLLLTQSPRKNRSPIKTFFFFLITIAFCWFGFDLYFNSQQGNNAAILEPLPRSPTTASPVLKQATKEQNDQPQKAKHIEHPIKTRLAQQIEPIKPIGLIKQTEPSEQIEKPKLSKPEEAAQIIFLEADQQGHFRGKMFINNVVMPFLIDTGATTTVIPEKLAALAGLPVGESVRIKTAGGEVYAHKTEIFSLKVGDLVISHLDAQINEHLDEVLIGMNLLAYFKITLNENTMTLTPNNESLYGADISIIQQPIKQKTVIKKTVACDEQGFCVTSYTN